MKRIMALALVFALLLCGCGGKEEPAVQDEPETTAAVETTGAAAEETAEATTEPTTEPTTMPTEPEVYYNPLNGAILEEPFTGRVFAHTITNTKDAIPHVGVMNADILFEVYASTGVVRDLALFTDIANAGAIGGTRSTRPIFNDIAQHYDAILTHAGGSSIALEDAAGKGLDHYNVDSLDRQGDPLAQETAYRDKEHGRDGTNNLFGYGAGIYAYAEAQGVRLTQDGDKDYYLRFAEDGTPANGAAADEITMTFGKNTKTTTMVYDTELGKYVYNQYGKVMQDQITEEVEAFENVIIMQAVTDTWDVYQITEFTQGGSGFFACGGKLVPILWTCDDHDEPFRFMTLDGQELVLGMGNSYIAILDVSNPIEWKAVDNNIPTQQGNDIVVDYTKEELETLGTEAAE